ncbi:MAG: metal ABC transporter substrate-binding protein, partial [Cyanobacteria bacterium J06626_18]
MIFQSQIPSYLRASLAAIATTSLLIASCSSGPVAENTDSEQPTDTVSAVDTPSDTDEASPGDTAAADQPLVYVANYPLQYFAERIGGEQIQVELPVPGDIDPAFWEPTADELAQLQEADLIILNGATYEKWLQTASLPQTKTVDTAEPFSDRWIAIKETVTHQHGPEGEHSHEGTAFTTWVDPTLAIEQAAVIRDRLSAEFPDQADVFAANFEALEDDLVAIDEQIETIVTASPQQDQPLVASHPVYDYFAERYGLNLQSVLWEPESFPEEEQWTELEAMLAEHPAAWMMWEG